MRLLQFELDHKKLPLKEGSIIKYVGADFNIESQKYSYLFQVIGEPVIEENADVTHYNFPNSGNTFSTHIKCV